MNIQKVIIFFTKILRNRYTLLPQTPFLKSETETTEIILKKQTDILIKDYDEFIKSTLHYYDTVRFANIDMIYHVYKDIKKIFPSNTRNKKYHNYVILMAMQAYISENTLGTTFIFRDDTYQRELHDLISQFNLMDDEETRSLTKSLDLDSQKPWETLFKREKYNKTIKLASVFSMYVITGYYVKNTILFLHSIFEINKKSKVSDKEFLSDLKKAKALQTVIKVTRDRMVLSKQIMDNVINGFSLTDARIHWISIAFFNWETRNVLIDPINSRRPRNISEIAKYQNEKCAIKAHPKKVIKSIKRSKKVMLQTNLSGCSLQKDTYKNMSEKPKEIIGNILTNGILPNMSNILSLLDIIPVMSNINSLITMIGNLIYATTSFFKSQRSSVNIENNIQFMMERASTETDTKQKLICAFMNFIDIFLPFATAKRTYGVISNLSSINTEHSRATMLIIHKWSSLSNKSLNNKKIDINELFSGSQKEIEYKIIEMNLNYFNEKLLY